jgi:NAD(P)-dependent dehydrogenase (short-subunit alcohol dehydrogenase family)
MRRAPRRVRALTVGRIDGKVAIVTGGASGIGAATCRRFVAEGARVVVADIADEAGTALAGELGAAAAFRHTDVGVLADLEAVVAFAVERFGGLDVIHNNAVWSAGGYVHEIDAAAWDQSLRVMLTGVFYGMKAAIPAMLARGGGSIINTSSIEGIVAEILAAPYNTAKAGMINLSRTVAIEYGRVNIRSNCICPGVVDTPLAAMLMAIAPKPRAAIEAEHAIGRLIRPDEIANVALFLASDESSAVTGAAIVVDGGLISRSPISGFPPYGT